MANNSYPLSYVTQNLNNMVSEIFDSYEKELQSKAEKVTEKVAKDFAGKLKQVTPKSSIAGGEHLADTVIVTGKKLKSYGRVTKAQYVHYKKWQIVHLLEFGWTARNGKRIERTPFIRPLFDQNKEQYYQMYKEAVQK